MLGVRNPMFALIALILLSSSWLTAHVTLVYGLIRRLPAWRVLVALFVPLVAPVWGYQAGLRIRSLVWLATAIAYGVVWALGAA